MSTMPGLASKGEKTKSKYQSLDINNLYRVSRGENSEKQQQKSTLTYKHGMQSLGKVPNARRPPANLPSLKSEHSGSETSVPLVPPGGPGWGKQDSTSNSSTSSTTTTTTTTTTTSSSVSPQISSHQAAIALPVTTQIPPPSKQQQQQHQQQQQQQHQQHTSPLSSATPATTDNKSWSSVMTGSDQLQHPPVYQSPQFQHEFPSLSVGDGAGHTRTNTTDVPQQQQQQQQPPHYTPGLSLRPQTEGSWIQGGSRPGVDVPQRSSSVPLGAPPQLSAPAGLPQQQLPPQYRAVMPTFMYKGNNFGPSGNGIPNQNASPMNGRRGEGRPLQRMLDAEEITSRPIIKEEELNRMDEIDKDMGWTAHEDIDYNQKLAFSDDDEASAPEKTIMRKEEPRKEERPPLQESNNGNERSRSIISAPITRQRSSEDEIWKQRRNQHNKEVELAKERAKQRKEEEEKRFIETTKQGAFKKLAELEQKISKRNRGEEETTGTINPATVPTKPIKPAEIPLPDFQREKEKNERDSRSRTPNEAPNGDEKSPTSTQTNHESAFRQLTQIEGKSFGSRKKVDPRDQQNGPNFSRHFQNHLPPRFLKQQRSNSNLQQQQQNFNQHDNRWMNQNLTKTSSSSSMRLLDSPEGDSRDDEDDIYKDYLRQSSEGRSYRDDDYHYRRRDEGDNKWMSSKDKEFEKRKEFATNDDWHIDRREKHERPQRPDSRDSRASRDSRHSRDSEIREHIGSWADTVLEPTYEDKRRVVPGPITKDRIEADLRNEKRNLTQLKRGQIPEKKTIELSNKDEKTAEENKKETSENVVSKAWADSISPTPDNDGQKFLDVFEKTNKQQNEVEKKTDDSKIDNSKDDRRRNRIYPQNKNWSSDYRSTWGGSKRPTTNRGLRRDYHGTDSENSDDGKNKFAKKSDKDDKNKNDIKQTTERKNNVEKPLNYVPRGEPSRHGRGGGGSSNFRGRGGLSKRIDGYGPPPSKSPFSSSNNQESEKDKKANENIEVNQTEDKTKQNQQALSAGLIGSARKDNNTYHERKVSDIEKNKQVRKPDTRRPKPKRDGKRDDDVLDTASDNSADDKDGKKKQLKNLSSVPTRPTGQIRRGVNVPPPRLSMNEKRNYGPRSDLMRENSSGTLRSAQNCLKKDTSEPQNALASAIADISLKNKDLEQSEEVDEKLSLHGDSDGFQEVKSKKTVKERKFDEKIPATITTTIPGTVPQKIGVANNNTNNKIDKDIKTERNNISKNKNVPNTQLTQQQISSIPSLMATPIHPPPVLPLSSKNQFDRSRQSKLAPRFAKQRETNRLQKQMHQQNICDVGDLNKVNQSIVYNMKDATVGGISNAWDKSLGTQLRMDDSVLGVSTDSCKVMEHPTNVSQNNSPNSDKLIGKSGQLQDKAILDGTTPPVNTIIFENTNFKTAPGARNTRPDKTRSKLEDSGSVDNTVVSSYNKPIGDLLSKEKQTDSIQLPLFKEDNADIKLDFFDSELSHLTDDKSSKNLCMPRSMHTMTSGNSTISTADALNFKIQSVKKMWETPADHVVGQEENSTFSSSFVSDPNTLDPNAFKGSDAPDDNHEGYSPSPNQVASNNNTNVCKVKPTQQVSGAGGQAVLSSSNHQPHTGIVPPTLIGNPLSPPPLQTVIGANVGIGQPPQQYTSNQHLGYQTGLGGSNQYGISAIPSPPTVMYNSTTQQLQAAQTAAGLYGPFQLDQLSGQGRTQFSQYPNHYNLGQTASSPYSAQSVYLQTAQPHPPPTAQAPPDLYQNMSSYRLSQGPFGQSQQLNNPTTVLISSTSNSLMSATVKPSSQQISAIGTKAGGVGQAYQQQSQQSQQVYMTYDPLQGNYLQSAGVLQRGPAGPVQNNVVPALQPSSSYYSGSTGGQTGYFQQPGNSSIQSAQLQQHQAGYGLQGNVFGTHNQSHTNAGLQSFNSHFLSTPMLAALNAQQPFRSGLPTQYIKSVGSQSIGDQTGRSQQLKSPGSQEVLSSVFNSGSHISSPKLRQNCKQPPPQSSPTAQHKYNLYQGVGNQQSGNVQRYPPPIQRPVNFHQNLSQQNNTNTASNNQKHRGNNPSKAPARQYYQSNTLSSQNEKVDDSKLDANTSSVSSSVSNKSVIGGAPSGTNSSDIAKDAINIEDSSALKD